MKKKQIIGYDHKYPRKINIDLDNNLIWLHIITVIIINTKWFICKFIYILHKTNELKKIYLS